MFVLAMTIATSVDVHAGHGTHFRDLSPMQKMEARKWVLIIQCMSAWTLAMPKMSVVALLVRVFEPRRWLSVLFYSMAIFGVIIAAITTVIWSVQCRPTEKLVCDKNTLEFWDSTYVTNSGIQVWRVRVGTQMSPTNSRSSNLVSIE